MKPLAVSTEMHRSSLPAHWSPSQSWQKWQSVKTQSAFHGILQLDCNVAMSPTYIILCVSTASFVIKMTCVLKDIILVPYGICNLEREAQCLMVLRSKWHYAKLSRDSHSSFNHMLKRRDLMVKRVTAGLLMCSIKTACSGTKPQVGYQSSH